MKLWRRYIHTLHLSVNIAQLNAVGVRLPSSVATECPLTHRRPRSVFMRRASDNGRLPTGCCASRCVRVLASDGGPPAAARSADGRFMTQCQDCRVTSQSGAPRRDWRQAESRESVARGPSGPQGGHWSPVVRRVVPVSSGARSTPRRLVGLESETAGRPAESVGPTSGAHEQRPFT